MIEKEWKRGIVMDNRKPISVRINHHKASSPEPQRNEPSSLEDYIRENHHPVMDDQHVFRRNYTPGSNKRKQSFWSKYKSLLISSITAILIGSFLGIIMLRMFVDIDPEEVAFDASATNTNNQPVSVSSAESEQAENYQSEEYTFFVTQAGVFSSEAAASQLVQELKEEQIDGMIWPRDNNYHVFVSVTSTNEASKEFTAETFSSSDEMYSGKEWRMSGTAATLTDDEKQWITKLEDSLEQMIAGEIDKEAIKQLLSRELSNQSEVIEKMRSSLESLQALENEQKIQVTVLQILYLYEKLAED